MTTSNETLAFQAGDRIWHKTTMLRFTVIESAESEMRLRGDDGERYLVHAEGFSDFEHIPKDKGGSPSPTPLTDALEEDWEEWNRYRHSKRDDEPMNPWRHARRLERELASMTAYADKLAQGLPEGMLPKDVENLREANAELSGDLDVANEKLHAAEELLKLERAGHPGEGPLVDEPLDRQIVLLNRQVVAAEAACAEMRAAFQPILNSHDEDVGMDEFDDSESVGSQFIEGEIEDIPLTFGHLRRARKAICEAIGQGWHSPEEWSQTQVKLRALKQANELYAQQLTESRASVADLEYLDSEAAQGSSEVTRQLAEARASIDLLKEQNAKLQDKIEGLKGAK